MIDTRHAIGTERRNVLFITLDSLRYDAARTALDDGRAPALAALLPDGRWEERRTPGTFTFPAHQAFFAGFLPKTAERDQPARLWECEPPQGKPVAETSFVFPAANILDGFTAMDYRTVCIGGVTYFSSETPLGSVFPAMFAETYWKPEFGSNEPESTRHQVDQALGVLADQPAHRPLFLFLNVSATHVPFHHYLPGGTGQDSVQAQAAALSYADGHLGRLLDALPQGGKWLVVVCADHGEALGEDGYYGHGIAHPVVWTVPYGETLLG